MPIPYSLPLAFQAVDDLRRDAGLRGDEYDAAVLGIVAVFVIGLGVIGAVLLLSRRNRKR